ncbi:GerAB/ArcD/ProY family transporter [Alkaliphilus pronyensis]|uniref:GerAB/ArcD/ProY family transporter n=1 Tax=Alkaliphilus pronyensis TaxID=1482732 RepID=A0A6I0F9B7_9FIRM|nr:GerAB/ArcD/ProY family transporter [Alkaliphilus pronyensis]KAB3534866.1 GerAB/ArcD/ProY family transporter [Alkaliphilus pronyensis]
MSISENSSVKISLYQFLLIILAQLGGAIIIYLPGVNEAGHDVWISNIFASIVAYIVVLSHYLPQSQYQDHSMTKIIKNNWGVFLGAIVNIYYFLFFYFLATLIISDVYYFGEITMPETPGSIFIIFFIVPAIYAVKLGLETIARLIELLIPATVIVFCGLFILLIPKLDFLNITPIMAEGFRPVFLGAIPNMNFPYAQILPIVFLYKNISLKNSSKSKLLKYMCFSILTATILLTLRSIASIAAFDEATLITRTFPPFSAIRLIELGDVIERLDALFLAIFYCVTFMKFILTYYAMCEITSEFFDIKDVKTFALPIGLLCGVSMPLFVPRFDFILTSTVPYFLLSIPLFAPIPILLYLTIRVRSQI